MSAELSFGEQAAEAIEEASENVIESYMVNADLSWIPAAGAACVIAMFLFTIAVIWTSRVLPANKKILRTIACALWGALFSGLLILLASFASAGSVTAPSAIFAVSSISIAAGSIACAASRTRGLVDWFALGATKCGKQENSASPSPRARESDTDNVEGTSEASGTSPSERTIKEKYSRMLVKRAASDRRVRYIVSRVFEAITLWLVPILAIGAVSLLCFMFLEMPSNTSWIFIAEPYMACELSVIAGIVAGCWLVFQRRPIGFAIPMALFLMLGAAEYFVETFKGAAIMPSDLRSMNTGMAVAGGYEYEIGTVLIICIALFALAAGMLSWIEDPLARFLSRKEYVFTERYQGMFLPKIIEKKQKKENIICVIKNAIACLLSILLGLYIIQAPIAAGMDTDWEDEGIIFDYWQTYLSVDSYGLIPSFMNALQLEDLEAPPGYSTEKAQELQNAMASLYDQYIGSSPERAAASSQFEETCPNVVMIMNETFADLSRLGGLGVGYEGPLFVNNMNAIAKGSTDVSVYGGGTCNSEFEGLTGTSLGLVGGGISPYAIYDLSSLDTIPKQFKALGYDTTAIHPEYATNWGRDGVYPAIGFDTFIDKDSFEGAETSRGHYADAATYDKVMEVLRNNDSPQFVFDLTMMNHGGYETGMIPAEESTDYDFTGIVDESAAAATNEYLSSIRMSDEDVQQFLEELKNFDEPTVVMFYGDHHPGFSWWFQESFANRDSDISYQESMYETEYFVWSNYAVAGNTWNPSEQHAAGDDQAQGDPGILGPVLGNIFPSSAPETDLQIRQSLGSEEDEMYPDIQDDFAVYRGDMSPASLAAWTLSYIGAPLTDYEKANFISRWWIQSNNIYGYMDAAGTWHSMEEVEAIAATDIYAQAMQIISDTAARGSLPTGEELLGQRGVDIEQDAQVEKTGAGTEAMLDQENGNIEIDETTNENLGDENIIEDIRENISEEAAGEDPITADDTQAIADEVPPENTDPTIVQATERDYQDAVMVNVMKWLAYLNFSSLIK